MNRCGKAIKNPTVISYRVEGVESIKLSFFHFLLLFTTKNKWKDKIDSRAYEALMNWNVDITD